MKRLVFMGILLAAALGSQGAWAQGGSKRGTASDTLANGIPRAALPALTPWAGIWRRAVRGFQPASLARAETRPLDFAFAQRISELRQPLGQPVLQVWLPDSAAYLNIDVGTTIHWVANGVLRVSREAESAPLYADLRNDKLYRLRTCAADCLYDWAAWIDSTRFAVAGMTQVGTDPNGPRQAFLEIYDLTGKRVRRWLGQPVDGAALGRYRAASDWSLMQRYPR